MKNLRNYIVVNNDAFEAVSLDERPLNVVLVEPDNKTWTNKHTLTHNNVRVCWQDHFGDGGGYKILEVFYKKTKLYYLYGAKIQEVVDTLNRFNNIPEEELDNLYEKALNKVKSNLELEVEKLKEEKQKLIAGAKTFAEFVKKGNELLSLMKDLDIEEE